MIKINVDTVWQGQVAIRDKYLKQSQDTGEDILIIHGQDQMLVRSEVAHKYRAISAKPVKDKYGKESHFLLYYDWKPTVIQGSLV